MPVRNQHSANFVPALFQVSCIWKYVINTGSLYFAESKSAINDKNVASEFYGCHVSSHLLNSGKGNDAHGVFRRLLDRGIRPTIARIGLMFYARFASSRGVRRARGGAKTRTGTAGTRSVMRRFTCTGSWPECGAAC